MGPIYTYIKMFNFPNWQTDWMFFTNTLHKQKIKYTETWVQMKLVILLTCISSAVHCSLWSGSGETLIWSDCRCWGFRPTRHCSVSTLKFTTPGSVVGIPVNWWKKITILHDFLDISYPIKHFTNQQNYSSEFMIKGHSVVVTIPASYSPYPEFEYHRKTNLPENFHGFFSPWREMLG
jgi:hypothetical protein